MTNTKNPWWYRLLKILYILACIFSFLLFAYVWLQNAPIFCLLGSCPGSYADAFLFGFEITLVYIVVIRLIKLSVVYVVEARKPEWRREFKRLF